MDPTQLITTRQTLIVIFATAYCFIPLTIYKRDLETLPHQRRTRANLYTNNRRSRSVDLL